MTQLVTPHNPDETEDEALRAARFAAALAAVREAIAPGFGDNTPSDEEITQLIEEARKRPRD